MFKICLSALSSVDVGHLPHHPKVVEGGSSRSWDWEWRNSEEKQGKHMKSHLLNNFVNLNCLF
jgi:hypothetical protein